jgi:hypothetical protein
MAIDQWRFQASASGQIAPAVVTHELNCINESFLFLTDRASFAQPAIIAIPSAYSLGPEQIVALGDALAGRVGHQVFISP